MLRKHLRLLRYRGGPVARRPRYPCPPSKGELPATTSASLVSLTRTLEEGNAHDGSITANVAEQLPYRLRLAALHAVRSLEEELWGGMPLHFFALSRNVGEFGCR